MKRHNFPSASSKNVILALNAESVFAIHWIIGYLKKNINVLVISPYDLKKNPFLNDLREEFPKSASIQLFQITSKYGYFSKLIILRYLKAFIYFYSMKRKYREIIFHTHYLGHFALLGLILRPKKLIVTLYGSDVYSISGIRKFISKLLLRRADLVHPQSKFMVDHLVNEYKIPKSKMITFHTGVNLKRWKKPSDSILNSFKENMDIPQNSIVFLSYRRFTPIYQIHLLPLIHFKLLQQNIPAYFIYLMGSSRTRYHEKFEELIIRKKLSRHSKLINYVLETEDLVKLVFISDYFFSIPKWDQVAATVQEGMYCECIPILSDLKVYKEVVNEKRAIFVSTKSPHRMAKIIGKSVLVDMHLNEKIKKINKNIIINNYNMEENLSKLIDSIFAL